MDYRPYLDVKFCMVSFDLFQTLANSKIFAANKYAFYFQTPMNQMNTSSPFISLLYQQTRPLSQQQHPQTPHQPQRLSLSQ